MRTERIIFALVLTGLLSAAGVSHSRRITLFYPSHRGPAAGGDSSGLTLLPEIIYRTDPVTKRRLPQSLNWSHPFPAVEPGTRQDPPLEVFSHPSGSSVSLLLDFIRRFRRTKDALSGPCGAEDVVIVGDNPPDEVVVIDQDTTVIGDICIINSGELRIEGAEFTLVGDITIKQDGRLAVSGGSFRVLEEFRLQFQCMVMDSARFEIENSQVSFGGQNWALTCVGNAFARIDNCTFPSGIITGTLLQGATMTVRGCRKPGEFIPMDSTSIAVSDCDSIMTWFTFPVSSGGTFESPGEDSLITHWEFPTPSVFGIDYHFVIDSTSQVLSGLLCSEDITLTVENSDFVSCGIIFWEGTADTIEIKGIINDTDYSDYTLDLHDRDVRLVNTHVGAWNMYPFNTTILKLENDIFGEIMANDSSRTDIYNSICDGSGGHVMTEFQSELETVFSSILTQVISRNRSLMLFFGTSFPSSGISADGSSVMMFFNSSPVMRPVVRDTALAVESLIGLPTAPTVDADVPITGTALITPGPHNQFSMDYYLLHTAPGVDPQSAEWVLIDSVSSPIYQDTLAVWNTEGLDPGYHMIRLTIASTYVDSFRFTIPTVTFVYLNESVGIKPEDGEAYVPFETALNQNTPNPFNPNTVIGFSLSEDGPVRLEIYNARGRSVRKLLEGWMSAGLHHVVWDGRDDHGSLSPSGVYFCRLALPENSFTRKMVLAK